MLKGIGNSDAIYQMQVVSALALTWCIIFFFSRNIQFRNHFYSLLKPFDFMIPKTFKLFGFHIFWLQVYLMKIIPETRLAR
jgi:hypothetical protein